MFVNCLEGYPYQERMKTGTEMLHEVLRRSGTASLNVHVVVGGIIGRKMERVKQVWDFLNDQLLSKHWDRLEEIEIHLIRVLPVEQLKQLLSHFERPALLLLKCSIHDDNRRAWRLKDVNITPYTLFSNSAPRLIHMRSEFLHVSNRSSCLSGLTTFITTKMTKITDSVEEILVILSHMTKLIYLELRHYTEELDPEINPVTSHIVVDLPCLTYMDIDGFLVNCFTLVESIKRSHSGCMVNISTYTDINHSSVIKLLNILYNRTFPQSVMVKHPHGLKFIFINISIGSIQLGDAGCLALMQNQLDFSVDSRMSSDGVYFAFQWCRTVIPMIEEATTEFLTRLAGSQLLDEVTTIRLRQGLSYNLLLPLNSGVRTTIALETDEDTAGALTRRIPVSQGQIDDSNGVSGGGLTAPFPYLTTLCVEMTYTNRPTETYIHNDLESLREIMERRGQINRRIETLKLYECSEYIQYAKFFEGIPGLKRLCILYGDGITEYEYLYTN